MPGLTEAVNAIVLQRKRERLWELLPVKAASDAGVVLADFIHQLNEDQLDEAILNHSPTWESGPFKRDPETGEYCYPERAAAASS